MALILHPEFQLYEKKDMPFCSSLQVAESFEKQHGHVLRDIQAIGLSKSGDTPESVADFYKNNFVRTTYLDTQGKKQPMFIMTKNGFTLLVMGYTGERAMRFKVEYIQRFDAMEDFIKKYILARDDFAPFTQAIMDAHDEPKSFHYSNEADMINRIVLGCTAKQFKELHGLGNVPSIRPFLSHSQAKAIRKLQTEDIRLLYKGVEFQDRKTRLYALASQLPILS
ncbi:MAG: Rha family transcriptional regulator [Synergistaceae bacterium]|nr:Rha family transcriptional regulator [Synergistaceae bacterium]